MTIEQLKLQIKEVIFPNGKNEIDGGKHQGVLLDLVDKFDVDVRDLARALKELSDELNNKDESQSNALKELADKVDEHVLYTDNELNKKVDNEAYNLDKEAIETSISENKTAIDSNKESYELDKETQKELDEKQNIDLAKHSKSIDELNNLVKVATSKDEPILTAEGGGVISLPSNAMSSVAPNYRINGLTNEELKSVQTPMRVKSVGENLFDPNINIINRNVYREVIFDGKRCVSYLASSGVEGLPFCKLNLPAREYNIQVRWHQSIMAGATLYIYYKDGTTSGVSRWSGSNEGWVVNKGKTVNKEIIGIGGDHNSSQIVRIDLDSMYIGVSEENTPYVESNSFINNNIELKSVGEVSDYIENGKLYKNISDNGEILEKTEVVNLSTSGQIVNKPNGTIFIEPVTNITDYYTDSLDVSEYNIVEIEEFSYYKEGVYHQLDTSKVVIKEGKLTYPNLENTIVYMVFKYDDNPIYGVNSVDYYNDKGVLVSPDGTFWKPTMEVSDEGSITLKGEKL